MAERQRHNLKSDIIVGVGGVGLALTTAFFGFRAQDEYLSPHGKGDGDAVILYGVIDLSNPDCVVKVGEKNVECKSEITTECAESLLLAGEDSSKGRRLIAENCEDQFESARWEYPDGFFGDKSNE